MPIERRGADDFSFYGLPSSVGLVLVHESKCLVEALWDFERLREEVYKFINENQFSDATVVGEK